MPRIRLTVCSGPTCFQGRDAIEAALRNYLRRADLQQVVELARGGCYARCGLGPNLLVQRVGNAADEAAALQGLLRGDEQDDACFVHGVTPDIVPQLVDWFVARWSAR